MGESTPAVAPAAASDKWLREYETVYLLRPDLADEAVDKLSERLRGVVAREGGRVIKFTVHGKKKTAFAVKKNPRAIVVQMQYLGRPGLVAEIERNLRLTEDVMKLHSLRIADRVDPDSRPTEQDVKLAGDIEEAAKPREDRLEDEEGGDLSAEGVE